MKRKCMRCGKEKEDIELLEVAKDAYSLCQRCIETFYRRWSLFMAGG